MTSPSSAAFTGRYILVADEEPSVVAFVIRTLRDEGHCVFHAYDGRSAVELASVLRRCDLIISNTRVDGMPGLDLIRQLREHRPSQPIIYIANMAHSTPEIERQLPPDVPILREPFGAHELRAVVAKVVGDSAKHRVVSDAALDRVRQPSGLTLEM
jgi:two-component system, NtrC family, response regulator AtoC